MLQQHETPKLSKAESARINGSKSKGAVTPEGKANSANGNLKHGLYSKRVLMDGESAEGYEYFKSCFLEVFLPADAFETECVESLVTARWRIRRLESTETSNLNIALASNKEAIAAKFDALDIVHECGVAVQSQIAFIEACTRVQERLHRIYDRNYKLLATYRRKSGRHMPASVTEPRPEEAVLQPPVTEPCASASGPALNDQPNSPAPSPSTGSVTAQMAICLVIFALLLLTPITTMSKSLEIEAPKPAFHASAHPFRDPAGPRNSVRAPK